MSYTKLTDFAAKDALLSGNPSKLLRGTEIGAEFDAIESAMAAAEAVNITAPIIAASTSKTTPVGADVLPILDSAASNILKKVTWANIKATLKTYFDTLYAAVGAFAASGANADITSLTALTAGGLPNNSVLTADIADANVTPAKLSQPLTMGTVVATTSGTSIAISTTVPSWVKRITLLLNTVSTNGTSNLMLRIGDSGGVETSGYSASAVQITGGNAGATSTAGFIFTGSNTAASTHGGQIVLSLIDQTSQMWLESACIQNITATALNISSGQKALTPGSLTSVYLTTVNGTDTFDAGSVNILYE